MMNIDLLRKRNNWVVMVFAGIITAVQVLNFILGIPLSFVLTIIGIIYGILAPFAYISNQPRFQEKLAPIMKYFNLIVIGAFMFVIIALDPHMINVMSMYFFVAVMGIYQDKLINILTIFSTLGILTYYFVTEGDVIFHSTNYQDLMYYILTFCFVSIASILQSLFNNKIQEESENQKLQAIEAKESVQNILNRINESLVTVSQYQNNLNKTTENASSQSSEIVASIQNIISSFDMQTKQSDELVKGMCSTTVQVEDMTKSITEMHNYVESTKEATEESGKRIEHLEHDLENFNELVQSTIEFMKQLYAETDHIEKNIRAISDISNETNMLALNAQIVSAHAGEQGKGFSVVASRVKDLSESTKNSSDSIAKLLLAIREKIKLASNTISQSQESIERNRNGMNEVKMIFTDVDSYMKNFSEKTKHLQEFIGDVQGMMQEVEAKAEISAEITDDNKRSLEDVLGLVSNQHEEISSLSNGFGGLEKQIRSLNQ